MKPVNPADRIVKNIYESSFEPFVSDGEPSVGETVLQLDDAYPLGAGFHVYRLAKGCTTTPHRHNCDEQFLMLEGELQENDGTVYKPGDLVLLKKGTEHASYAITDCLLAVFIAVPETSLNSSI